MPPVTAGILADNFNVCLSLNLGVNSGVDMSWKPATGYHIYPTPPLGQDMTQGQFF